MKPYYTNTKTEITKTERYNINDFISCKRILVNGRQKSLTLFFKKTNQNVYNFQPVLVVNEFDELRKKHTFDNLMIENYKQTTVIPQTVNDCLKYRMIYVNYYDHMLFDDTFQVLSCYYNVGYIEFGIKHEETQSTKDYHKSVDKIKNNPYVTNFQIIEIPYYNADFKGQLSCTYSIFVPDNEYRKIYEYVNNLKNQYYRIYDVLSAKYIKLYDLFNLNDKTIVVNTNHILT